MDNIKERLNKYVKEKHITLSEEAIEKMINFANSFIAHFWSSYRSRKLPIMSLLLYTKRSHATSATAFVSRFIVAITLSTICYIVHTDTELGTIPHSWWAHYTLDQQVCQELFWAGRIFLLSKTNKLVHITCSLWTHYT